MRCSSLFVLLAVACDSVRADIDTRAPYKPAVCAIINKIVVKAKAQKPAALYCSSFLKLSAGTKRTTTTTSTSTIAEFTTTFETSATTVDGGVSTSTVFEPSASLSVPAACMSGSSVQRRSNSIPKPAALAGYRQRAAISSACSCLCTKTVTPFTTTFVSTTVVTDVQTSTNVQTVTTFTTTTTVTETTASAVTNFQIIAKGGGIDGLYANPRPTNGEIRFDSSTPEAAYRLRDDCGLEVASGDYSGRSATYRSTVGGNQVYASSLNEQLVCQVVLGQARPQLECPIDGNGTNAVGRFGNGEWRVGAIPDRIRSDVFTANLVGTFE